MGKRYRRISRLSTKEGCSYELGEESPRHAGLRVNQIEFMQTGAQGVYNPINIPVPHYRIALEDPFHPEDSSFRIIPLDEVRALDYQEVIERDAEEIEPVRAE